MEHRIWPLNSLQLYCLLKVTPDYMLHSFLLANFLAVENEELFWGVYFLHLARFLALKTYIGIDFA